MDKKTKIILDGHYRFKIFQDLRQKNIPVYYVDYADQRIILDSWKEKKVTKKEVVKTVKAGKLFPNKTTKYMFQIKGRLRHISQITPRVDFNIKSLKKKK